MIAATAPGKMILMGEYAVLHGANALVCAMNCRASVKLSDADSEKFEISAPSLSIGKYKFTIDSTSRINFEKIPDSETMHKLHFFKIVFEEAVKFIKSKNQSLAPVNIEINTDDFYSEDKKYKYGFGSSAAMTVALLEALLKKTEILSKTSMDELFRLSYHIHHKAQGNLGSGIDIAASVYGNVLMYQLLKQDDLPPANCLPITRWNDLFVLPVWAGHSTSTRKMVQNVQKLEKESPEVFNRIMDALIRCSEKGCTAYIGRNREELFESVAEYNHILSELGAASNSPIISDSHKKLIDLIANYSANAIYKPSGAGGGDIGVAFCDSTESVETVKRILKQTEFHILDFTIANEGAAITTIRD